MANNLRETYTSGEAARERRRAVIEAGYQCFITYGGGEDGRRIDLIIALSRRRLDFSKLPAKESR